MRIAAALLLLLTCGLALAQTIPVPPLQARVTDQTGTLNGAERSALDSKLAALEREKGSQIAVLLLPTTGDDTIEQYGIRVADAWKLGREGVDDGIILLVAKNDRKLRIEVGYGLEGAVPDVIAKHIVADIITPYFRQGDYYTGISAGVDALIAAVKGEPLPEPKRRDRREGAPPIFVFGLFILLFFLLPLLRGGRRRRGLYYGGIGGIGGLGGGFGGRGGGGFGGGGFGGGGGGFGGGGASGGW